MSHLLSGKFGQVCLLPLLTLLLPITLVAQVMQGPTTVRNNVHHDTSLPLSTLAKNAPLPDYTVHEEVEEMKHIPSASRLVAIDRRPGAADAGSPDSESGGWVELRGPRTRANTASVSQYIPPDTNGAVGATQYVQWVNASFAVFDKATGAKSAGTRSSAILCGQDLEAVARPTTTAILSFSTTSWRTAG